MSLWVPPTVERDLVENRRQFTAMLDDVLVRDKMLHVAGLLDEANYRVRQIDERLEVARAPETVPSHSLLKPAYYVLIRWNEGAPPTVINLEGPNGEFVDLDGNMDGLVALVRRNDLRNPENRRRLHEAQERQERALAKQKDSENEERREELRDRLNAVSRTSVSMNPDTPWTQNAAGARRTRKWRAGDVGRDRWR